MKFVPAALVAFSAVFMPLSAFASTTVATVPSVPFYSQFSDISSSKWQKVGCGITSLAMLVSYYKKAPVSVDALLTEGIKAGAYSDAGWTYSGLLAVAKKHGLTGTANDVSSEGSAGAFASLTDALMSGPVIASVHYKLEPTNPIPHLIVVNAVRDGFVYYNDPAAKTGQKKVAVATFRAAWKMRYITIRPADTKLAIARN